MDDKTSDADWLTTFHSIKDNYHSAYNIIEQAISLEEQEKHFEALETYKNGILIIDNALNVCVTCPDNPDHTWKEACEMIYKLKKTRGEVLTQINNLLMKQEIRDSCSTVEAKNNLSKITDLQTYTDLGNSLKDLKLNIHNCCTTLIYEQDDVMMYFISPDGSVKSTAVAQKLTIFSVEDEPSIFLQIGNWVYPLIAGLSPCYRTNYNSFIFPDIHSGIEDSSVGILLPEEGDKILHELLINILHGVVIQHTELKTVGEKIGTGIVKAAGYLAQGLIASAEGIGNLLNYGTPKIISNITPSSEPKSIPPALSNGLKMTETATNKTAELTGYVAGKVALATSKLGQYLAPHIEKRGTALLQSGLGYNEQEASSKMKNTLRVAASAVEGFSTVYSGLEISASILSQNLKNNTVKIVQYKYGTPAGDIASDTLTTVGNVVNITRNAHVLTPKGLAKTTVKATGKALTMDNHPKPKGNEHNTKHL